MNAFGYFRGTTHIALQQLENSLALLPIDREIIVTDLYGGDAAKAAVILKASGFKDVSVLLEGIDRWHYTDKKGWNCKKDIYVPNAGFTIINSTEFAHMNRSGQLVLDVRTKEEFDNRHADAFRNIGRLKNAVHVPVNEIEARMPDISKYKGSPVIIYGFGGGNEAYNAADILIKNGFTNVHVLAGGLFNIRWTASNVPGMVSMHDLVEGVPEENR